MSETTSKDHADTNTKENDVRRCPESYSPCVKRPTQDLQRLAENKKEIDPNSV